MRVRYILCRIEFIKMTYNICGAMLLLWLLMTPTIVCSFFQQQTPSVPIKTRPALIRFMHVHCPIQMSSDRNDNDDEMDSAIAMGPAATNVIGTTLCSCCTNVGNSGIGTGFYRNGYCATGQQDIGRHTVCVQVTTEFLQYSKSVGNDLSTPIPQFLFPGLHHGDIWCLCAERWVQAYSVGMAPKVYLQSTHEKTLDYISYDILRQYAIDDNEADKALHELNEQRDRFNKLL